MVLLILELKTIQEVTFEFKLYFSVGSLYLHLDFIIL